MFMSQWTFKIMIRCVYINVYAYVHGNLNYIGHQFHIGIGLYMYILANVFSFEFISFFGSIGNYAYYVLVHIYGFTSVCLFRCVFVFIIIMSAFIWVCLFMFMLICMCACSCKYIFTCTY